MQLREALITGKKIKRQKEFVFLTSIERVDLGFTAEDLIAEDWFVEEHKTDKVLAAELVIRLLENLTNEISKHNKEIRQEVKELREKLDIVLNKPIYINNSGVSLDPWIPFTMKMEDPTQPIATVLEWNKTND